MGSLKTSNLQSITVIDSSDPDAPYKLHSGCVKGKECREGSKCGEISETACEGCSFDQCKALAAKGKFKGFAYSSVKLMCRLCDETQFQNIQTNNVKSWGLYVKFGNFYH